MTMRTLPLLLAAGVCAGVTLAASSAAQTSPRRLPPPVQQTSAPRSVAPERLLLCAPVSSAATPATCAGLIVDLNEALPL